MVSSTSSVTMGMGSGFGFSAVLPIITRSDVRTNDEESSYLKGDILIESVDISSRGFAAIERLSPVFLP